MRNNTKNSHEILLGLTTTPASDWRAKVAEIKKLGIKKIALFPTFLGIEQRKELYALLEDVQGLEIPHVHLRNQDMETWEMELFENKYKAIIYNIHMGHPLNECLEKYRDKICIENHFKLFDEKSLSQFAGICFDVQHLKRAKIEAPKTYAQVLELLKSQPVGCCHISAFPKMRFLFERLLKRLSGHYMLGLSEIDYVAEYRQYLPYYVSLELENSFEQQLKVKEYLEKILKN